MAVPNRRVLRQGVVKTLVPVSNTANVTGSLLHLWRVGCRGAAVIDRSPGAGTRRGPGAARRGAARRARLGSGCRAPVGAVRRSLHCSANPPRDDTCPSVAVRHHTWRHVRRDERPTPQLRDFTADERRGPDGAGTMNRALPILAYALSLVYCKCVFVFLPRSSGVCFHTFRRVLGRKCAKRQVTVV